MSKSMFIGTEIIGTEAQIQEIIDTMAGIEEFPGDPNRIRLRFKNGKASNWYSRLWNRCTAGWLLRKVSS